MTLKQYAAMVVEDLTIDQANVDDESGRTAALHSKYLLLYLDETRKLEQLKRYFDSLWHERKLYYLGKAPPDVYKADPQPLKVTLKSEVEEFLKADAIIQAADVEVKEQEKVVKYLNDMIKQINQRGFEIRAIIDWQKFKNGLNN